MIGEVGEFSFYDLATRCRTILRERPEQLKDQPITIVINSAGGCMFEMFAIIDYIKSLKVKVNVICRGQAMSAAAMILACTTGSRICSKHSTIMLHEASIGQYGKSSDIQASAKQYKKMEEDCLTLLAESTKKDVDWWRENTRKDLFLSAEEALELGIIDLIG
jgi:ATP-dependent Clp protease protease subunit